MMEVVHLFLNNSAKTQPIFNNLRHATTYGNFKTELYKLAHLTLNRCRITFGIFFNNIQFKFKLLKFL